MKKAQLQKIKAQMSSIWVKECMLMIVCLSDLTLLPLLGGGRKLWYIIIIKILQGYIFRSHCTVMFRIRYHSVINSLPPEELLANFDISKRHSSKLL